MTRFSAPLGVPVKQALNTDDGLDHDNFYLLRMDFVDHESKGKVVHKPFYHLFTTKELVEATMRYYHDMDTVIGRQLGAVIGYAYPITYENRNAILTTRFFCRFKGDQVEGLEGRPYCGLFTAREIRRSRDRVSLYLEQCPSLLTRIFKKLWNRKSV